MKISRNKLNNLIESYLNDVNDYGDESDFLIAENVLNPIKQLITESKNTIVNLNEMKAKSKDKAIIEDLILYIQNI